MIFQKKKPQNFFFIANIQHPTIIEPNMIGGSVTSSERFSESILWLKTHFQSHP